MELDPAGLPVYNSLSLPDLPFDFDTAYPETTLPAYAPPETTGNRSYSSPRPLVQHIFTLPDQKGRTWLTLKVNSSAQSALSLPNFFEGKPVTGLVELELEKPDSISAVVVSVST